MRYLLIDEAGVLHDRNADTWSAALAEVGPEGGNRIQLTRDLAAYVNDCGLVLPDKYRRNPVGGLLLMALGAQRIPYAGPILLVGWDGANTMMGKAEIVGLHPIQAGMVRVVHTLARAWLGDDNSRSPALGLDVNRHDEDVEALELADMVERAAAPGWSVSVVDVPPIGDILTLEPVLATDAASPIELGPDSPYLLRTIGEASALVAEIVPLAGDTEDDLIDAAKDAADQSGWAVTDCRREPGRWVLTGGRHLNLGS